VGRAVLCVAQPELIVHLLLAEADAARDAKEPLQALCACIAPAEADCKANAEGGVDEPLADAGTLLVRRTFELASPVHAAPIG